MRFSHIQVFYGNMDSREGPSEDFSAKKNPPSKARELRMEVAQNWMKKLKELEKKNYPAGVAKIMATTNTLAQKWTEPFTRDDAGAVQIAMGNIAGKYGERVVKEYNNLEEKAKGKSEIVARIAGVRDASVSAVGTESVYIGRGVKDGAKQVVSDIKKTIRNSEGEKKPPEKNPDSEEVRSNLLNAKKIADDTQTSVVESAKELSNATENSGKVEEQAKAAGENAQKANKDAKDAIINAVTKNHEGGTQNRDVGSSPLANDGFGENNQNIEKNIQPTPELRSWLLNIKDLQVRERRQKLVEKRNSLIKDQLLHPDEAQKKMLEDFAVDNKDILSSMILDSDFQKKLQEGTLASEDYLKQEVFLKLFLDKQGEKFLSNMSSEQKKDIQAIDYLMVLHEKAESKLYEAEEATRDFADAKQKENKAMDEYLVAAEQAKRAQANLNEAEYKAKINGNITTQVTNEGGEYVSAQESFSPRRERFRNLMYSEIGGNMSTRVERQNNGSYSIVSISSGQEIGVSGWSNFPKKREARRAQIRYELFSEKPLDTFLSQDPQYLQSIQNDPIVRNLWNQVNPSERMRTVGFRRLIMVGLMKKMNPEKYQALSYQEVLNRSGGSVIEEFHTTYDQNRKVLGLQNAGKEDIRAIMRVVVDPSTWNTQKETPPTQVA